ncbi:hypothetical protein GRI62_11840 [Erythrobacter arachoides]|uniref:Phage head morphogenesis domain-containing protein n=1 Tax=Aurantiacibacter arachoides TaxID=1850444 RepID=A0A845A5S8_9SPHN|nr:minor capsid protein [Aurantiacibacter arachoides]MXO94287.1 hypothetical protein [Aurantiacibacter arachoides]GGD64666.1 hypothetical protein GCM10011411_26210 [Aurantiacibacter arachoides]
MTTLRDLQIRHAIYRLRYANGVDEEIQKLLDRLERKVAQQIGQRLADIDERGNDLGPATTRRLNQLFEEISAINADVYGVAHDRLKANLIDLAEEEMEFAAKAVSNATGIRAQAALASPTRLASIVTDRPIQGKLLASFFKGAEAGTMNRIEEAIRDGMATGKGLEKIVREVRKEAIGMSKRSASAIVRTSITSISNHAQMEAFKRNQRVIKAWMFNAILDSKTTPICAALDKRIFPIGQGPTPARHINCRSTITAVTDLDAYGIDPDQLERDGEAKITKRPQDDDPTFEKWMADRGEAVQNQILGKTRAQLWRDGKYSLRDFIRNNREVIPLSELRRLQPVGDVISEIEIDEVLPAALAPFNPRNPNVTAETIEVQSRLALQKALRPAIEAAHKTNRFKVNEFRGNHNKLGKVNFSANFDDETVSMIAAIMPEIDAITDRFNVPRLRGLHGGAGANASASMGDGVLAINPTIFNGYAAKVGRRADAAIDTAKIEALRAEHGVAVKAMNDALGDYEEFQRRRAVVTEIAKRFEKERRAINKQAKQASINRAITNRPVSTWKVGDDVKDRPSGSQHYFSDIDKARVVMYHETAHTIHQEYKRTGYRRDVGLPPIEIELQALYNAKVRSGDLKKNAPTSYAMTNSKEWFAESFALYMMGREDLVDVDLIELIERIARGQ